MRKEWADTELPFVVTPPQQPFPNYYGLTRNRAVGRY
ncbi:hypothetical protein OKW45_005690 [Paraburkholderia sp. WSM4175]